MHSSPNFLNNISSDGVYICTGGRHQLGGNRKGIENSSYGLAAGMLLFWLLLLVPMPAFCSLVVPAWSNNVSRTEFLVASGVNPASPPRQNLFQKEFPNLLLPATADFGGAPIVILWAFFAAPSEESSPFLVSSAKPSQNKNPALAESDQVKLSPDNPNSGESEQAHPHQTAQPEESAKAPIERAEVAQKLIAITFDDGPYPGLTSKCLDILDSREVSATFFVVGNRAKRWKDAIAEIAARGHEVANHSWRHLDMGKWSAAAIIADMEQTNRQLQEITGVEPRLFRPPYGSWQQSTMEAARKANLTVVDWDIDPRDWTDPPPRRTVESVTKRAHPGSIVLLHEGHTNTLHALPLLLDALKREGYRMVTVSELLASEEEKQTEASTEGKRTHANHFSTG